MAHQMALSTLCPQPCNAFDNVSMSIKSIIIFLGHAQGIISIKKKQINSFVWKLQNEKLSFIAKYTKCKRFFNKDLWHFEKVNAHFESIQRGIINLQLSMSLNDFQRIFIGEKGESENTGST